MTNFICPCCGHKAGWSKELADIICQSVDEFVDSGDITGKRFYNGKFYNGDVKTDNPIRSRLKIFYLLMFTGEPHKTVAFYFKTSYAYIGYSKMACIKWLNDKPGTKNQIEKYISLKLSEKKYNLVFLNDNKNERLQATGS